MLVGVAEFTSTLQEDSTELMKKVQALVVGVARDYMPAPLYIIRIDNWFGPKWMHFAGEVHCRKRLCNRCSQDDPTRAAVHSAPGGCRTLQFGRSARA
jgi:hypothetical protein